MSRRSSERVFADAIHELAKFVSRLWPACDGAPESEACTDDFEVAVGLVVDVLRSAPAVLRRHPDLAINCGEERGLLLVSIEKGAGACRKGDRLWVTADGRTRAWRWRRTETVRLDRRDLSRRIEIPTEFGSVDRERDAWPSLPVAANMLLQVAEGPLLELLGRASPAAAAEVKDAITAYERSTWLDAKVRSAIARKWKRETVVARVQPFARTDVGDLYDLLICDAVLSS